MAGRTDTRTRRVLLLAAHPNDEFGIAATLRRHAQSGDGVWVAWFAHDDRFQVEQRRSAEARTAMERIGVPEEHTLAADLPPVALASQLPEVVAEVRSVVADVEPDLVYCPAYEGGHPDHDALNFAAYEALALAGVDAREYPIYRKSKHRGLLRRVPRFARMIPGSGGDSDLRWLDPKEVEFKRDLWRVYRTQRPLFDVLLRFSGDEHRFFATEQTRPLPLRDYSKPPHERPLLYEQSTDSVFSFDEFADAVRRYHWSGGIGDDQAL